MTTQTVHPAASSGRVQLHHASYLDVLPSLKDNSIDCLITDPPYASTEFAWDVKIDWPSFWSQVNRVCKPNACMVLFSAQPFTTDLINSNRKNFRYEQIWVKPQGTNFLNANRRPLTAHENILLFAQIRRALGWSQSDLKEFLGCSLAAVKGWEGAGTEPDRARGAGYRLALLEAARLVPEYDATPAITTWILNEMPINNIQISDRDLIRLGLAIHAGIHALGGSRILPADDPELLAIHEKATRELSEALSLLDDMRGLAEPTLETIAEELSQKIDITPGDRASIRETIAYIKKEWPRDDD